jgi:hypothetical protein
VGVGDSIPWKLAASTIVDMASGPQQLNASIAYNGDVAIEVFGIVCKATDAIGLMGDSHAADGAALELSPLASMATDVAIKGPIRSSLHRAFSGVNFEDLRSQPSSQ